MKKKHLDVRTLRNTQAHRGGEREIYYLDKKQNNHHLMHQEKSVLFLGPLPAKGDYHQKIQTQFLFLFREFQKES